MPESPEEGLGPTHALLGREDGLVTIRPLAPLLRSAPAGGPAGPPAGPGGAHAWTRARPRPGAPARTHAGAQARWRGPLAAAAAARAAG